MLARNVGSDEHAAREHEFPMDGDGFGFEHAYGQDFRVVYQHQFALWRHQSRQLLGIIIGVLGRKHPAWRRQTCFRPFLRQVMAVVDDKICAQLLTPSLAFRPRSRGHHRQIRQLFRQLNDL